MNHIELFFEKVKHCTENSQNEVLLNTNEALLLMEEINELLSFSVQDLIDRDLESQTYTLSMEGETWQLGQHTNTLLSF